MVPASDLKDRGVPLGQWSVRGEVAEAAIGRAFAWLAAGRMRAIAALLVLTIACFLPGLAAIPPIDIDEASFAQSSKQMIETGNYVDIRIGAVPRYKKPVGAYWVQAAVVQLLGYGSDAPIGAYRMASFLGAVAAVLLTYWTALALFGPRAALLAGGALALSVVLIGEAHLAKTDAILAATVVLAMGALARLYLWNKDAPAPAATAVLFWIGLAAATLVKGPIGPMVAVLTISTLVAIERRVAWLKRLRWKVGVPLYLAIVLPWFVAILIISGGAFLRGSVGDDLLGKIAVGQESHGAPPGTHFLLFWVMFWPAAVLAVVAFPWVWRNRALPAVRFCFAWIVPTWLVFEAVHTKLPHYLLPTYPAIAALIGAALAAGARPANARWSRIVLFLPLVIAVVLAATVIIGFWRLQGTVALGLTTLMLLPVAVAVAATAAARAQAYRSAAVLMAVAAVGLYAAGLGVVIPRIDNIRLSPRLAEAVKRAAPCDDPAVLSAGYAEPSLLFTAGSSTRFGDASEAAAFLAEGGCRVALVAAPLQPEFLERSVALHLSPDRHETVTGMKLDTVDMVDIGVYTAGPAGQP